MGYFMGANYGYLHGQRAGNLTEESWLLGKEHVCIYRTLIRSQSITTVTTMLVGLLDCKPHLVCCPTSILLAGQPLSCLLAALSKLESEQYALEH